MVHIWGFGLSDMKTSELPGDFGLSMLEQVTDILTDSSIGLQKVEIGSAVDRDEIGYNIIGMRGSDSKEVYETGTSASLHDLLIRLQGNPSTACLKYEIKVWKTITTYNPEDGTICSPGKLFKARLEAAPMQYAETSAQDPGNQLGIRKDRDYNDTSMCSGGAFLALGLLAVGLYARLKGSSKTEKD